MAASLQLALTVLACSTEGASAIVRQPDSYRKGGMLDNFGGFYTDANHFTEDSFAGVRMFASFPSHGTSSEISLVGSDDGRTFWTLHGEFTDESKGHLSIDFSPKGGPKDLNGKYMNGKILWPDGNKWSKVYGPPVPEDTPCGISNNIGGFYIDPHHYKEGTLHGTRFVSNSQDGFATIVGTDDGSHFWALNAIDNGKGKFTVDFSSKGGPKNLVGEYSNGKITWPDGNAWTRPGPPMPAPSQKGGACQKASVGLLGAVMLLLLHL